jgi:hypothetical protein
LDGTSSRLGKQRINVSTHLLNSAMKATDEADLERFEVVAELVETLNDVVEVVFQSSNTVTVVRVSDVKLSRHTDDQVLDLGQRGGIELVGEQLRGLRIAEGFAHRSDEDILGEESAGEFLVDLLVGVEKSSGTDERLVAFDIPERSARTDHQTLLNFVKKVSDAEAVAGGVGEAIVLCLLGRCVASDEEIFVDLVMWLSGCNLEGVIGPTNLVTSLARKLQKLQGTLRQRRVSRAVLLVLGPMVLLAVLAAVEGDLALATLESAILEARAGSTTNFLESRHFWLGVSM